MALQMARPTLAELEERLVDMYESILVQMCFIDNVTIRRASNLLQNDPDTDVMLLYDVLWDIGRLKKGLGFSVPDV